jgi:hypothetical protein
MSVVPPLGWGVKKIEKIESLLRESAQSAGTILPADIVDLRFNKNIKPYKAYKDILSYRN